VARGLTTPSKPYLPKDDPSTPAVVISDTALTAPVAPQPVASQTDRARVAQTIPAQTRSAPLASPAPLSVPPAAAAHVDDTYPAMRRRSGSKLPLVIGGLAVLGVGAIAVAKLNGSSKPETPASTTATPNEAPAAAPTPSAAPVPDTDARAAAPEPPAPLPEREPEAAPPAEPEPTEKAATKPTKAVTKRTAPFAPARRPARTDTKSEPKSAPATEPATPKPKGVIVRETPF
jgi:hypothetical protein